MKYSGLCVGGELAGQWIENDTSVLCVAKREPLPDLSAYPNVGSVCREVAFEYEEYQHQKIGAGKFSAEVWALTDFSHADILKELLSNYRPKVSE